MEIILKEVIIIEKISGESVEKKVGNDIFYPKIYCRRYTHRLLFKNNQFSQKIFVLTSVIICEHFCFSFKGR